MSNNCAFQAVLTHQEEHRFALVVDVITEFQNDPENDGLALIEQK